MEDTSVVSASFSVWSKLFFSKSELQNHAFVGALKNSFSKNLNFPKEHQMKVQGARKLVEKALPRERFSGKFAKYSKQLFTATNRTCLLQFFWVSWLFILLSSFIYIQNCLTNTHLKKSFTQTKDKYKINISTHSSISGWVNFYEYDIYQEAVVERCSRKRFLWKSRIHRRII